MSLVKQNTHQNIYSPILTNWRMVLRENKRRPNACNCHTHNNSSLELMVITMGLITTTSRASSKRICGFFLQFYPQLIPLLRRDGYRSKVTRCIVDLILVNYDYAFLDR